MDPLKILVSFSSLPFQWKQVYSFFSGSCLPACLCIHGLFTCCPKLQLLVTSLTGGGLNEPKASMADVPQDSGARGCPAGDPRPPLCRQSLDLSLKAGWILPPRRGAGRPVRDVWSVGDWPIPQPTLLRPPWSVSSAGRRFRSLAGGWRWVRICFSFFL